MNTSLSASTSPNAQAIAKATISPQLQTALSNFHSYYPSATIVAELVTHRVDQFIVRALISDRGHAIASAMAASEHIENAEDRAKLRAIVALLAQHHASVDAGVNDQGESHQPNLASKSPSTLAAQAESTPDSHFTANLSSAAQSVDAISTGALSSEDLSASVDCFTTDSLGLSKARTSLAAPVTEPAGHMTSSKQPKSDGKSSMHQDYPDVLSVSNSSDGSDKPIDLIEETDMPETLVDENPSYPQSDSQPTAILDHTLQQKSAEASTSSRPKTNKKAPKASGKAATISASTSSADSRSEANLANSEESLTLDLSDIIAKTSVELDRLGWTNSQGRAHLQKVYGKRSRQQLTDPELIDFLRYLESQPNPETNS